MTHPDALERATLAARLGHTPGLTPEQRALCDKLERVLCVDSLSMENVVEVETQGIRVVAGDARYEVGSGDGRATVEHTVAYYEADGLRFPGFALQPAGFGIRLLGRLMSAPSIAFPSHPAFSKAYYLSAEHEANTRTLFNGRVLDALGRRPGFHVRSGGASLVMYPRDRILGAEETKRFIGEAADIFCRLEKSARGAGFTPDRIPVPGAEPTAAAGETPDPADVTSRKTLVTRRDVAEFLRQAPPRRIPRKLQQYRDKYASEVPLAVGIMFAGGGMVFMYGFGSQVYYGKGLFSGDTFFGLLGLLVFAIGFPLARWAWRTRRRVTRLLKRGRTVPATITGISTTGTVLNGEKIYRLSVRYRVDSREIEASCDIAGYGVDRAERLAANRKTALMLYDPAHPRNVLFVDGLVTSSPEHEL